MPVDNEFKFFGQNMEKISILYGCILVVWAIFVSAVSQSQSITSFIPAFLGLPIGILGFISAKFPERQKLLMHIVVLLGVLVCLGGLDFFRGLATEAGVFSNFWAGLTKLLMLITGAAFSTLCVKSFVHARKVREADLNF